MAVTQPLRPPEAKKLVLRILERGGVEFSDPHAFERMRKHRMGPLDIENVLKGGVVDEPEWENGELRYRVRTSRFEVIIAFENDECLTVVTAWRLRP